MKKKALGFLTYCFLFLIIPFTTAETSINETIYLNTRDSNHYQLGTTAGLSKIKNRFYFFTYFNSNTLISCLIFSEITLVELISTKQLRTRL